MQATVFTGCVVVRAHKRLELYFQHCRFEAGVEKTNAFSVDARLGVVVHGSKALSLNFPSWVLQGWIWGPDRSKDLSLNGLGVTHMGSTHVQCI